MLVTFSLPVRETVTAISPALFPHWQTSPVLFSAQLNAHDYAQLVADGGSIELWSNIDSGNDPHGAWSERRFLEPKGRDDEEHSNAYTSHDSYTTSRTNDQHIYTFYLPVALPALDGSDRRRFSFTYRIVYSSGHIVWLGDYEQDGHLFLEAQPQDCLSDLKLSGSWSTDYTRGAYVRQCEEKVDMIELAATQSLSDFYVRGISRDRFADNLQNVSALFLIPRTPGKLPVLRPAYILSASPNMHLSVSADGLTICSSGTGNVVLQVKDYLEDPSEFMQQVISRCNLDEWNIVGSDMKQAVALVPTADSTLPIRGTLVSFWPSDPLSQFVKLDASYFGKALADHEVDHFAVLPSNNEWMKIAPIQTAARLSFHVHSSDFTIAPVHRLKHSSGKEWGVAILSNHTKIPAPYPSWSISALPTPPASPPVSRILDINFALKSPLNILRGTERMSLGFESLSVIPDHEVRNDGEVEEVTQEPEELKDLDEQAEDLLQHQDDSIVDQTERNLANDFNGIANTYRAHIRYGQSIIWILQCLFASLFAVITALLGVGPVSDLWTSLSIDKPKEHLQIEEERSEDDVGQVVKSESGDDDAGPRPLDQCALGQVDTADKLQTSSNRTVPPKETVFGPVHLYAPAPIPEDHVFHANIHQYELNGDDDLGPATAVVNVVLFPFPDVLNAPQNRPYGTVSPDFNSSLYNAMQTAVAFIDKSGPLPCAIDRLQSFWCAEGAHAAEGGDYSEVGHPISFTSYLLQYQPGSVDASRGTVVRIEVPEV